MSMWENKTEEERKAMVAKGQATAARNRAAKQKMRADLADKRDSLKVEIMELERHRDEALNGYKADRISIDVSGKSLLREHEIVAGAVDIDFVGVYFLVSKNRVVYVGQSVNVFSRLTGHSDKEFDSITYIKCKREHLDKIESLYIHVLQPTLNGNSGPGGTKSAPIMLRELFNDPSL